MYKVCLSTKTSLPLNVFWDARLTPTDVLVLGMYMSNSNTASIAEFLGIDESICLASINNLVQTGYLRIITAEKKQPTQKKQLSAESFIKRLTGYTLTENVKGLLCEWLKSLFQSNKGLSFISFETNVKSLIQYTNDEQLQLKIITDAIMSNHATLRYVIEDDKRRSAYLSGMNKATQNVQEFPTQQQIVDKPNRKITLYENTLKTFWLSFIECAKLGTTKEQCISNVFAHCGINVADIKCTRNKLMEAGMSAQQIVDLEKSIAGGYYCEL